MIFIENRAAQKNVWRINLRTSAAALSFLAAQTLVVYAEPLNCGDYSNTAAISLGDGDNDQFSDSSGFDGERNGPIANEDICRNLAIANALAEPDLIAGEKFGIKLSFGTAANEDVTAVGIGLKTVLSENLNGTGTRLTGSGAIAVSGDQRGTRLGLQLSW
ncbi:hypothetical protein [Salaquimonas pukyongi]|uniref:hypothetical protein n=1 Tax=Salaquimonas pukyongi TaxID=2712698 RepID=UPI00096BB269|nr:hypothetical protein [Salaquimonas pukyongi]